MTIRHLGDASDDLRFTADVCVVGGGIAGLLVAQKAAEHGASVVVLESGGRDVDDASQELNEIDSTGAAFSSASGGRFRGLGGSSARWGGRFLPLHGSDVGARPHLGLEAWPMDIGRLERFRPELEALFHLTDSSYEEDVLEGLDRAGVVPRDDPDLMARLPKWAPYKYCNLGSSLASELESSGRIEVLLGATVCGFDLTPAGLMGAVTARTRSAREVVVTAREFVLAAGAVESTRLLLLLDAAHDGRVFRGCDALGRYLQDHLGVKVADLVVVSGRRANRIFGYRFTGESRRSLHLDLTPAAQVAEGAAAAFAHVTLVTDGDSATDVLRRALRGRQSGNTIRATDVGRLVRSSGELARGGLWFAARRQHFWPDDVAHQMNVWIEQVPDRGNQVSLAPTQVDPLGQPKARITWAPGLQEERTFRAGVDRLSSYWMRHGLSRWCDLRWTEAARSVDGTLAEGAMPVFHPTGSTRMGSDPVTSVVGPDLRCHAVPNLLVAASSVFPTAGSAGPTYTLALMAMDIGERVANGLV